VAAAVATVRQPPLDDRPADPDDVVLVPVDGSRQDVLSNLVQLYRHDLSEFRGYELSEAGTYDYAYLDVYLRGDDDREAWFIRVEGRLAGFALTRRLPDGVWEVAEFFVARPYRRRGVGRVALAKAFALHEGRWTCFVDDANGTSARMCTAAAADAAGPEARATRGLSRSGLVGTVFRLAVPEEKAASASPGCCAPAPIDAAPAEVETEEPGPLTCC
jgi:predicted acetyltransferase